MSAIGFFGVVGVFILLGLVEAAFDARRERRLSGQDAAELDA